MTTATLDGTRFLLLDGWQHRRAPGHWQGWLAERLVERGAEVDYLTLPDPERPDHVAWSTVVRRALAEHPQSTVIAHGLSVLLWFRMCGDALTERTGALARRAMLVAPPATGKHGGSVSDALPSSVTAAAIHAAAETSLLVYSMGDPYLPIGASVEYGERFGIPTVEIPGGDHLNQASGYGPWPAMLAWCETGEWPGASGIERELDVLFQPAGHRLGVIVAGAVGADTVAAVDRVLRRRGIDPARRCARLQPRPGESVVRCDDVADFGVRYGHEYQVAVLASRLAADAREVEVLEQSFAAEGVSVIWADR